MQLYNSFQPGLYKYEVILGKIEKGEVYLKAYEITRETPLSTGRLVEKSRISVENKTDSLVLFRTKSDFTIYEGDWGQPYAARFEVWFKPEESTAERKLVEKNDQRFSSFSFNKVLTFLYSISIQRYIKVYSKISS